MQCRKAHIGKKAKDSVVNNMVVETVDLNAVAVDVKYDGLWQAVKTFPKRRPFAFGIMLNSSLCVVADWLVQHAERKSTRKDKMEQLQRSAVFFTFGAMQGATMYFVYCYVFRFLFPNAIRFANLHWRMKLVDTSGQKDLAKQIAFDNFIYTPFYYFPNFYFLKALLQENADDKACDKEFTTIVYDKACHAIDNFKANFVQDNVASMALWGPADIFVYSVSAWARMPLATCVNFTWVGVLSFLRGEA
jgi:hypothetical protein